ncbi:hypothetical protein LPJ81_000704, partial [Coemansia sp. IMI 209127]
TPTSCGMMLLIPTAGQSRASLVARSSVDPLKLTVYRSASSRSASGARRARPASPASKTSADTLNLWSRMS